MLGRRDAGEHVGQCGEREIGHVAREERLGRRVGVRSRSRAVQKRRHVIRQFPVRLAPARVRLVQLHEFIHTRFWQQREQPQKLLEVSIVGVEPELEERVRAGSIRGEPDRSQLGLAELSAVGLGDQRRGEAEGKRLSS